MTGTPGAGVYLAIVFAGAAVTYVWRLLGVVLVKRLDPESVALKWVRAVATALVAALVARMIFVPSGLLADTSTTARVAAIVCGLLAWRFGGRRVELSVAASVLAFFTLQALSG